MTKSSAKDNAVSEKNEIPFRLISLDLLDPDPNNPRTAEYTEEDPGLDELAASIGDRGVISPIMVTPIGDRYRIIAGHRRFQAATKAGLKEIPAVVQELRTPNQVLITQLVENIQRQKLSPLDLCNAIWKLKHDYKMSGVEIGRCIGRSTPWVSFILGVAESKGIARQMLEEGKVADMTAAYRITTLPEVVQNALYAQAEKTGEKITKSMVEIAKSPPAPLTLLPEARSPREEILPIDADKIADLFAGEESPRILEAERPEVYHDFGTTWIVRAQKGQLVKLLQTVGKPADTDEAMISSLRELLSA